MAVVASVASPDKQPVAFRRRSALAPDENGPLTFELPTSGYVGERRWSDSGQESKLSWDVPESDPLLHIPEIGHAFLGFQLVAELGRGAFGQVFLAHQGDLANRPVVLKVSEDLFHESQTLAQLHHPHVMPIHSLHRAGKLQAVCMPYFGATTLADVLTDLKSTRSVPASGKELVATLNNRQSITRERSQSSWQTATPNSIPAAPVTAPPAPVKVTANLDKLEKCNYVEAVLWLGAQLADGLAHAHERGILHRDLKPANILITEEGQPMLLDFNLSVDTKVASSAAARMGGTLPYMSPEQLRSFCGKRCAVDARTDLFSLGVILFEMLTEQHPYPNHTGHPAVIVPRLLADRLQTPPDPRPFNRMVSPAAAAIVRKCLAPDVAQRYQTAKELKEDLERHLEHRPLAHAREPSLAERAAKWKRRNARLVAGVTIAAAVSVMTVGPLGAMWVREQRDTRLAREVRDEFRADFRNVQGLLNAQNPPRQQIARGVELGRAWLARYGVLDETNWREAPQVRRLPPEDQARIDSDVEELLLLIARGTALLADGAESAERTERLQTALTLNTLAETNTRHGEPTRAVWLQRAELARQLGQTEDVGHATEKARAAELKTPRDHYLAAVEYMSQRKFRAAVGLFHRATTKDPQYFWAWFGQGMSYYELGEDAKALACFNAAIALWPDSHDFHFYRGLVYHRQRRYPLAQDEFDEAIRLRPDWPEPWLNRGIVQGQLGRHRDAVADFTRARDLGTPPTRVYFLRAVAYERAGDKDAGRVDREEGMRREPTDEVSWIARGLARLEKDPRGALADFEQALTLNPRSYSALQNKAHVLADRLENLDEALGIFDRMVESYPDGILPRLGRGVLLARQGKREAALADVKECLARDDGACTNYHVANIYALTSAQAKEDAPRALHFLAKALQGGYGVHMVGSDPDFARVRDQEEFRNLVAAAQTLGNAATRKQ